MNSRNPWTIVAIVIALAVVFLGYRLMTDRRMTAQTSPPPVTSTEQTGSIGNAPATGTVTPKPADGAQTGTSN